jgi:hypothetical protein
VKRGCLARLRSASFEQSGGESNGNGARKAGSLPHIRSCQIHQQTLSLLPCATASFEVYSKDFRLRCVFFDQFSGHLPTSCGVATFPYLIQVIFSQQPFNGTPSQRAVNHSKWILFVNVFYEISRKFKPSLTPISL